ncbi:SDR family NAD(P)-dependent oxidoreductase [Roseibium aggregatum]|uniref:SDR family NAD(P)-dependent oxidoreductase n=1 Tax=Roseibium aggregatum TaxID=187304 RepID=A0A926NXQ1_9HYPH|nr:SDR family NAD(P)-dependent oxidoreductase [Roseibium aggregatum]MBD1548329.1 SDR family NAD(P)-dependent oxidoreductase [Roseibium aggregatum]
MEDRQKRAWVVGASSGIGAAVALKLADAGYLVAASARNEKALDLLATEAGGPVQAFPVDILDRDAVERTFGEIEETMGPVDLAVFAAGIYLRDEPGRFDAELVSKTFGVNLMGTSHCLEAVLAKMVPRRSGHVAIIASVSGYAGLPGGGVYGASKSALITLAEAIYPELKEKGIAVSVINPGFVRTPLTARNDFPMPFMISAEDAAERIVRGLQSMRFEIAFPKRMVFLLKLLRLLPYPLFFAVTKKMLRADRG